MGLLPGEREFRQEFPGADLTSSMLARSAERFGTAVDAAVSAVWRAHGLSHAAGNALAVIEGAHGPTTPGAISAAMHITSGSITSLLDTLQKRALVERTSHADDRRKVSVVITDAGSVLLDEALPAIQLLVRTAFDGLTAQERTQLLGLIQKAFESVTALDLANIPSGTRHRPAR
ncbi:MAG: MarR family transcriptional regulator [Actinomycetota bacterium]